MPEPVVWVLAGRKSYQEPASVLIEYRDETASDAAARFREHAVEVVPGVWLTLLGWGDHMNRQPGPRRGEITTGASVAIWDERQDNSEPVYEPGHSEVSWEHIAALRSARAVETDDLADWYEPEGSAS